MEIIVTLNGILLLRLGCNKWCGCRYNVKTKGGKDSQIRRVKCGRE